MKIACLTILAFTAAFAQETGLTARELYYSGAPSGDAAAPAKPVAAPKASPKAAPKAAVRKAAPTSGAAPSVAAETGTAAPAPRAASGKDVKLTNVALRLGLRYNLLLIDDINTGRSHEVDPDRSFKSGECFQVKLRPNRSGRMYVFNHGSSGAWHTLLPSALALGESTEVTANTEITVARDHCFKLDDRKGTDTLVIAISDKPEDVKRLDEPAPAQPQGGDALLAMRRVTSVMGEPQKMVSRDMSIQKIGSSPSDPPNSVFVVKNAASTNDRLVIEIPLRHD